MVLFILRLWLGEWQVLLPEQYWNRKLMSSSDWNFPRILPKQPTELLFSIEYFLDLVVGAVRTFCGWACHRKSNFHSLTRGLEQY